MISEKFYYAGSFFVFKYPCTNILIKFSYILYTFFTWNMLGSLSSAHLVVLGVSARVLLRFEGRLYEKLIVFKKHLASTWKLLNEKNNV